MKTQDQIIQDEMRQLIRKSCEFTENLNRDSYGFQKALLKFYFGVIDVTIDYDSEIITLWQTQPRTDVRNRLYDLNDTTSIKVAYTNLEETLKGCLEEGDKQQRFYRSLLLHYHNLDNNFEEDYHSLTA
ncbi:MAG: hypothetical protein HKN48_03675 [Flavobacteriaceae bacterium]|nr:hypothetical protein [Flavobacteriaceae bacterium]